MSLGLIVTAAGASTRFGEPKQFYPLDGEPMVIKTIKAFQSFSEFSECIITINEEGKATLEALLESLEFPFPVTIVLGGKTRRESVEFAVNSLKASSKVLIHDGARPFVSQEVIQSVITAIKTAQAVIPGVPSVDTLKVVEDDHVQATLNRDVVYRVQTPQAFDVVTLKEAYSTYTGPEATDEAMLIEKLNIPVQVVMGDEANTKVTFKTDCN